MKRKAIIVDLDSTLFDDRHRLHYIDQTIPKYDAYHYCMKLDEVNEPVKEFIEYQNRLGVKVIIVTARPETFRDDTIDQLRKHDIKCDLIYMRKRGDIRGSVFVKKDYIEELLPHFEIKCALEDKPEVIGLFQELKIPVLKIFMGDKDE